MSRRTSLSLIVTFGLVAAVVHSACAQSPIETYDGGAGAKAQEHHGPVLSNRGPVQITPPALAPSDKPTYTDPQGRLEIYIDNERGYLKSLRFPVLLKGASARSIDRYAVFDGVSSSELDDQVTHITVNAQSQIPHIVVDCLNRASGIAVRKIYSVDAARSEVIKTVEIDAPSEKLVSIISTTVLSDQARKGGYYYQYQSHVGLRRMAFPADSIGDAYRMETGDDMHSGVLTVTRPDVDFTYGEVHLSTNETAQYLVVAEEELLMNKGSRHTLLTSEGWQLPRGGWVQVGPGREVQRVSWLYSATKGTHLMWHANYHKRYFFPAFAPERPLAKGMDLAFDASFIRQYQIAKHVDGRLEIAEDENVLGGMAKFKRLQRIVEGFGPRAWAPCLLYETTRSRSDFLTDNMYFTVDSRGGPETLRIIKDKDYLAFVRKMQRNLPRLHLLNYEVGGYWEYVETIQKHPELGLYSYLHAGLKIMHSPPRYGPYYEMLGNKYLQFQKEGLSLYTDGAIHGDRGAILPDGKFVFESHEVGFAGEKKMAERLRAAGGMYWSNQPSAPWADIGYLEAQWDSEIEADWRYMGDRLQLYKLHEFRPNTLVALFLMCDEYIHQCLAYNLVPCLNDRIGTAYQTSQVPEELARLRWPLRQAKMAPVPLRPVVWEQPNSPLETTVMTLPGTVYLAAISHSAEEHTADLSVDLNRVVDRKPYAIWKAAVTEGPWVGLERESGRQPEAAHNPPYTNAYKDVKAEVTFGPAQNAQWNGLHLTLPDVSIPKLDSVFFFMSTVPAVVRSVEGRDVLWPLSSQPHIQIKHHPDGTLLIASDYNKVVLAVHPDWLTKDAMVGALDERTGWPTITVLPGTWRLKSDGRLLYENRPDVTESLTAERPTVTMPPFTTGGPAGVDQLAVANRIVLQNGKDGYQGQTNEQMTTGQWGGEAGHGSHGGVNGTDVIFIYADSAAARHGRDLIRFDLEGRVPKGARVVRAILVIHCTGGINGSSVLAGYKALKPWTDGKTFWNNWGKGGDEPGYIDDTPVLSGDISEKGNDHFRVATSVVQDWLDRPDTNHGLLLKSIRDSNGFHWGAHGDTGDNPPKFVIEYDRP